MIELIRKRRSIRKYLEKKIETEKIDIMKEALLRSPSSRNIKPLQFIIIDDKKLLIKLSRCKQHGSAFLADAPLAVVVTGDETLTDVWIEDCSIAITFLQLTAESLGLGSCWIQIRQRGHDESRTAEEYISDLLKIPGNYRVEAVVALGYPAEVKVPVSAENLDHTKIKNNFWEERT